MNVDNNMGEKERWIAVNERKNGIYDNRKIPLNQYYSYSIDHDIKHLEFIFSRYKFAAKMLAYRPDINLLELGCNHGIGMQFFSQIDKLKYAVGIDFDTDAIKWAKANFETSKICFLEDDFNGKDYRNCLAPGEAYDAIVSIDVIEHIPKEQEDLFLKTLRLNLSDDGIAVIGTPNITMTPFASKESQIGHVNLFDQKRLYTLLTTVFQNVFIFGMTDEVLHTGFEPMCCYIMAVCAGVKRDGGDSNDNGSGQD